MSRFSGRVVTGADELIEVLRKLPQRAAQRLQSALIANHIDHKKAVIAQSNFSPEGRRLMKFAIRVAPSSRSGRVIVKKLSEVRGETFSVWRGSGTTDPDEGAAARIEKRVGKSVIRPKRSRFLLIPQGPMLTPSGRPKRKRIGGVLTAIPLRDIKDATVIKTRSGRRLLIRRKKARRRGKRRQFTVGTGGERIGTPLAGLEGERVEVIGVLVRQARQARPLDFFGSWDRLAGKREGRYKRLLDELVE